MHHYTFKNLSISYLNTWPTNAERREEADHLSLRSQYDYYVPFSRLCAFDTRPLVLFPKLWNEFTSPCKSTANKNIFKKELKTYFLEKLSDNYQCTRLLSPHCHLQTYYSSYLNVALMRLGLGYRAGVGVQCVPPACALVILSLFPIHSTPWAA